MVSTMLGRFPGFIVAKGKSCWPTSARLPGARVFEQAPDRDEARARSLEHRNLGVAFYRTGMLDEAVREFRRVAELRPDDLSARFHLGVAQLRLGKWGEAQTHLEAAARQRGAKPAVFHNLALALERLGRDDEAGVALAKALEQGGQEEPRTHLSLGVLALRRGEFEVADGHFMRARPLFGTRPPSAVWFHQAAMSAALAGQIDKTIALLTEGAQAHPHAAPLHNNLAVALVAAGRSDEARRAVERGLGEDPGLATLHRNHGDLLLEAGDQAAALEAYLRAVRHHETLGPEVWARIGVLRAAAGDNEEARAALAHALLLDPEHVEARARLAVLRGS